MVISKTLTCKLTADSIFYQILNLSLVSIIRDKIHAWSQLFQINFTLCLLLETLKQFFCFGMKVLFPNKIIKIVRLIIQDP